MNVWQLEYNDGILGSCWETVDMYHSKPAAFAAIVDSCGREPEVVTEQMHFTLYTTGISDYRITKWVIE